MRILTSLLVLLWALPAQALILNVEITPADGFVTIGQEVGMVLTATNDSNEPRPGFTIIGTNDIDGLSFPFEVPPCVLRVAQLNPPTSPISYLLAWDLIDLLPNETRRCETKFRVRTIPNGTIPIFFSQNLVPLAQVTYRAKPLVAVPGITPLWIGVLVIFFLFAATKGYKND